MGWTEERVSLLKQLWGQGKTASEIAKELGEGVSRNAVIGKAHRLKLSNRVSPIQQNKKQKEQKPVRQPRGKKQKLPEFKGLEVSLQDLNNNMCRWPSGDPKDDDFSFCGCETVPGLPYCKTHAQIAYQAATRNRVLKAEDFEDKKVARSDDGAVIEDEGFKKAVNA